MSWTPSLPMSPQPKSYHQRQMPGSRFDRYGTAGAGPSQRSKSSCGRRLRRLASCRSIAAALAVPGLGHQHLADRARRGRARSRPGRRRCCGSGCRPGGACPSGPPPRPAAALRGRCGSTASRRRRACRRRRARIAAGACQWSGVAIQTASTPRSSRTWRRSLTALGAVPAPFSTTDAASARRVAIDVADVGDVHVLPGGEEPEVVGPHPPGADQADGDALLGRAFRRHATERQGGRTQCAALEDGPAWDRSHRRVLRVCGWSGQGHAMIAPPRPRRKETVLLCRVPPHTTGTSPADGGEFGGPCGAPGRGRRLARSASDGRLQPTLGTEDLSRRHPGRAMVGGGPLE